MNNLLTQRVNGAKSICFFQALTGPLLLVCTACQAGEPAKLDLSTHYHFGGFLERKFADNFGVTGWEVAPRVYFGRAEAGARDGVGIMIDQGDHAFSLNHRGISLVIRF